MLTTKEAAMLFRISIVVVIIAIILYLLSEYKHWIKDTAYRLDKWMYINIKDPNIVIRVISKILNLVSRY